MLTISDERRPSPIYQTFMYFLPDRTCNAQPASTSTVGYTPVTTAALSVSLVFLKGLHSGSEYAVRFSGPMFRIRRSIRGHYLSLCYVFSTSRWFRAGLGIRPASVCHPEGCSSRMQRAKQIRGDCLARSGPRLVSCSSVVLPCMLAVVIPRP